MRYPVVNLFQMGGLLEDYQKENDAFKEKLSRLNQQAAAQYAAANPGPVYHAPQWPIEPPPPPPPPPPVTGQPGGATYFGPRPGPMVATGYPPTPPPPNPNEIQVIVPPRPPPPPPPGLPQNPPPTVSTGIPPLPHAFGPSDYGYPPIPPAQSCPPGYTWTPSGCLKDTPSIPDRPPMSQPVVNAPQPTGMVPTGGGGINSTPSWNTAPGALRSETPGVASVDCGPGKFWDGRECRGSVGSIPTIPGGGGPSGTVAATGFNPGGGYGGASFMGQVPLRANPHELGAPRLPMLRIRGY